MTDVLTRTATYADLVAAPPNMVAQILGGRLVTHPRPAPKHTFSASALGQVLGRSFGWKGAVGPGGWWILDEPELHLGDDVVVPDLAGWRWERMQKLPETAWFELPPDWVCEALSPSTARYVKGEKRDLYAAHGVGHLWHVDPDARVLEVFELQRGRWLLFQAFRGAMPVAAPPFDAVPFDLDLLWAD